MPEISIRLTLVASAVEKSAYGCSKSDINSNVERDDFNSKDMDSVNALCSIRLVM